MCNGVKRLLNDMGVAYSYIDVDLLDRDEKENTKAEMRKWHPKCPFPLLVINNNTCVIGNEPEQIKEAIGA
jgi:glutaredoxin